MKNELLTPDQLTQQMVDSWARHVARALEDAKKPPLYVQMWNPQTKQLDRVKW